jgi:hypothetical protein
VKYVGSLGAGACAAAGASVFGGSGPLAGGGASCAEVKVANKIIQSPAKRLKNTPSYLRRSIFSSLFSLL